MVKRKNSWLKERCIEFYDKYQGRKVYFGTFYNRVRINPEWDMEALIKPKERTGWRRANIAFTWAYADEMRWWFNQKEPKSNRQVFYGRVRAWYKKEEAILTGEKWQKILSRKEVKRNVWYKPTYSRLETDTREETYTWIDITYSKEEAKVFRKEFQRIIDNLEWSLTQMDEKTLVKETNDKLELVKAELSLFNLYNK